jgi:hypothetical protein
MIRVVETQTTNDLEFLTREGGKELFDGENRVGDLRGGVERRADDFIGVDDVFVPCGEADCGDMSEDEEATESDLPSSFGSTGWPMCTWDVSAAIKRMRRVQCCSCL